MVGDGWIDAKYIVGLVLTRRMAKISNYLIAGYSYGLILVGKIIREKDYLNFLQYRLISNQKSEKEVVAEPDMHIFIGDETVLGLMNNGAKRANALFGCNFSRTKFGILAFATCLASKSG